MINHDSSRSLKVDSPDQQLENSIILPKTLFYITYYLTVLINLQQCSFSNQSQCIVGLDFSCIWTLCSVFLAVQLNISTINRSDECTYLLIIYFTSWSHEIFESFTFLCVCCVASHPLITIIQLHAGSAIQCLRWSVKCKMKDSHYSILLTECTNTFQTLAARGCTEKVFKV